MRSGRGTRNNEPMEAAATDALADSPAPAGVERPAWCIACGYNLAGLPTRRRCPECGYRVEASLAHRISALPTADVRLLPHCAGYGLGSAALSAACIAICFVVLITSSGFAVSCAVAIFAATGICHWKSATMASRLARPLALIKDDVKPHVAAEGSAALGLGHLAGAGMVHVAGASDGMFLLSLIAFVLLLAGLPRLARYYWALDLLDRELLFRTVGGFEGYGKVKASMEFVLLGSVVLFLLTAWAKLQISLIFGFVALLSLIPWVGFWLAGLVCHGKFLAAALKVSRNRQLD